QAGMAQRTAHAPCGAFSKTRKAWPLPGRARSERDARQDHVGGTEAEMSQPAVVPVRYVADGCGIAEGGACERRLPRDGCLAIAWGLGEGWLQHRDTAQGPPSRRSGALPACAGVAPIPQRAARRVKGGSG